MATLQQLLVVTLLTLAGVVKDASAQQMTASCDLVNDPDNDVQQLQGTVTFVQEDQDATVVVTVAIEGFSTGDNSTLHGFHVHTDGDIEGGCTSAGGHYNPEGVNHGDRTVDVRHVGDLGNIEEDAYGNVSVSFQDDVIQLWGNYSIMGRAVVVHADEDDLGLGGGDSLINGNAGPRLACCVLAEVQTDTAGHLKPPQATSLLLLTLTALAFWPGIMTI